MSDDLISRHAAIDAAHKNYDTILDFKSDGRTVADSFEDIINALPSEQSEIIRCKNCKHYQYSDNRAFGFPVKRCEWTGFEDVDDDDFCSRAERK